MLGGLRQAEEFDEYLDRVLAGLERGDDTVRSLATVSTRLRAAAPTLRPEYRLALRERLVDTARRYPPAATAPPTRAPLPRRGLAGVAGVPARAGGGALPGGRDPARLGLRRVAYGVVGLALAVAVGGLAMAGSRALPGDSLYGVKRDAEGVQLALASGPTARGVVHLQLAQRRLDEARMLAERGSAPVGAALGPNAAGRRLDPRTVQLIVSALDQMRDETAAAEADLTTAWARTGNRRPLERVPEVTAAQQAALDDLATVLPPFVRAEATNSSHFSSIIQQQTTQILRLAWRDQCDAGCRSAIAATVSAQTTHVLSLAPGVTASPATPPAVRPARQPVVVSPLDEAAASLVVLVDPHALAPAPTAAAPAGQGGSPAGTGSAPAAPTTVPPEPSTTEPANPPASPAGPAGTATAPPSVRWTAPASPSPVAPPATTAPQPPSTPAAPATPAPSPSAPLPTQGPAATTSGPEAGQPGGSAPAAAGGSAGATAGGTGQEPAAPAAPAAADTSQ